MNAATVAALNRINRRFYSHLAEAFSASRSQPWPGWDRAVAHFVDCWSAKERGGQTPSILDVGCGNGRFAEYLAGRLGMRIRYFGLDESAEMLELARRRLSALSSVEYQLARYDLVGGEIGLPSPAEPYDLIVVCGLLHHIPGFGQRRALLETLGQLLVDGGLLVASFWQFGDHERFRRRFLDWTEHNQSAEESIDLDQLEPGDHLLRWGTVGESTDGSPGGLDPRRYCHHSDQTEVMRLVGGLGLVVRDRYLSDGRSHDLNLYCVLEQWRSPS